VHMKTIIIFVLIALVHFSISDPSASMITVANQAGFCMQLNVQWGEASNQQTDFTDIYCNGNAKTIYLMDYYDRGLLPNGASVWPQAHVIGSLFHEWHSAGDNVNFDKDSVNSVTYTITGGTEST